MNLKLLFMSVPFFALSAGAQTFTSGIDKANMDVSVKPGDDFYQYAAGGWLKSHPLDAEHTDNGAFTDLYEMNQKRILELIKKYADTPQQKGSLGQKIGTLYNLMMDSTRLNKEGWAPIQPTLAKIRTIKDRREYQKVMAQLDRRGESTLMFGIGIGADLQDANTNIVSVGQGGLGLGNRDYYLKDDEQSKKVLQAYKTYLKTLFMKVGYEEAQSQRKVDQVMGIENQIAKVSYDRVKLRDIEANYHKMTYQQLLKDFPGIDWTGIFQVAGFPAFSYVDVGQPEPIHEVEKILRNTPLEDLKTYAEINVISGAASQMSDDFREEAFNFSKVLTGVQQDRPRWKRAVSLVSNVLGEAIGKLYVQEYFPESSKLRMLDLVHQLQTALGERIEASTWMSDATKRKAIDKLDNYIIKIGYPEKWRDYSGLNIDEKLSLYENLQNIAEFFQEDQIERKVNKPVDKTEWQMTPQTVNAYYNPSTNEICFPAAILQPPFFDPKADDAANLGGIGAVIGHEMSHGFDDQGSQFDKYGNKNNWWTAEDKAKFEERTKVLEEHFNHFEIAPGKFINGKQTLGENIGDNGGLNVAYRALQNVLKENPSPVKDGFTPEQRFFLSYARIWASNMRPEYIDMLLKMDVHSPNAARVNAALPQIDGWYEAFDIKPSDKLFIPEEKRVRIW